jgi:hypothetical protein
MKLERSASVRVRERTLPDARSKMRRHDEPKARAHEP